MTRSCRPPCLLVPAAILISCGQPTTVISTRVEKFLVTRTERQEWRTALRTSRGGRFLRALGRGFLRRDAVGRWLQKNGWSPDRKQTRGSAATRVRRGVPFNRERLTRVGFGGMGGRHDHRPYCQDAINGETTRSLAIYGVLLPAAIDGSHKRFCPKPTPLRP
jgi:hypothetical protein